MSMEGFGLPDRQPPNSSRGEQRTSARNRFYSIFGRPRDQLSASDRQQTQQADNTSHNQPSRRSGPLRWWRRRTDELTITEGANNQNVTDAPRLRDLVNELARTQIPAPQEQRTHFTSMFAEMGEQMPGEMAAWFSRFDGNSLLPSPLQETNNTPLQPVSRGPDGTIVEINPIVMAFQGYRRDYQRVLRQALQRAYNERVLAPQRQELDRQRQVYEWSQQIQTLDLQIQTLNEQYQQEQQERREWAQLGQPLQEMRSAQQCRELDQQRQELDRQRQELDQQRQTLGLSEEAWPQRRQEWEQRQQEWGQRQQEWEQYEALDRQEDALDRQEDALHGQWRRDETWVQQRQELDQQRQELNRQRQELNRPEEARSQQLQGLHQQYRDLMQNIASLGNDGVEV